ncbi:MAG: extracellular solute-binding protein [Lacrimispora saccharolytica]
MAFIIFLLYAPIFTLIVLSFNSSRTRAKWGGFTLQWYQALFANEDIMNALYTTLVIALLSAIIATVLGTAASVGITSMKPRAKTVFMGVTNIPMLNGEIVMGISLMLLFIIGRIELGFGTILLAHITFNLPYVILSVMPKMKQTSRATYEAALDLGASPMYAFWKITFPDIMPGVISGFLLAFTMSLDDFVITYFTKGPGIDTLSTKIYSEVRKGIKPEMYSLSTILFATVLILLLLVNFSPSDKNAGQEAQKAHRLSKKKRSFGRIPQIIVGRVLPVLMVVVIAGGGIYYGRANLTSGTEQVIIYNWGEYIDPEVLDIFEEETGIQVIYEEFETNEIMYPKIQSGAIAYDLVCPSDYMIQKMIQNDLLQPLNFDNIPNAKNIGQVYYEKSRQFDPDNQYSIPYCWGTVGILYNTKMVEEPIDSWTVLWDTQYKDNILMQDSVRDAFAVALKTLGYSLNSTSIHELTQAKDLLVQQKPLVQAYVIDQVRDKMIGNEAAIGVIYSGGGHLYTDGKPGSGLRGPQGRLQHVDRFLGDAEERAEQENAEKFLDFLCRPEIALMNFEYITYSTPNEKARELIEDPAIRNSEIAFPGDSILSRCETFTYLGEDADEVYNQLWREVKSN